MSRISQRPEEQSATPNDGEDERLGLKSIQEAADEDLSVVRQWVTKGA